MDTAKGLHFNDDSLSPRFVIEIFDLDLILATFPVQEEEV